MTSKKIPMAETRILVVEDEAAIRDMITFAFTHTNFTILEAETVEAAKALMQESIPNLILLDWMLPGQSGMSFIHWLKKQEEYLNIPIIMLTAKAEEENRVLGLETGADDYVTKPFSPLELIARIKSILRRGPIADPKGQIHVGPLCLDIYNHSASVDDKPLTLTRNTYDLLHFFMTHPNRTYNRQQLISFVWGLTSYIDERTVDVQVRRLRDELKPYQQHHLIKTIRGVGYQFSSEDLDV